MYVYVYLGWAEHPLGISRGEDPDPVIFDLLDPDHTPNYLFS